MDVLISAIDIPYSSYHIHNLYQSAGYINIYSKCEHWTSLYAEIHKCQFIEVPNEQNKKKIVIQSKIEH